MSCPICSAPEGTAIAAGVRAGAGVLILVAAVVFTALARFGWRLWTLQERGA